MENNDSSNQEPRPGGVSVVWLQCLGLSKKHAEAVVAAHREAVEWAGRSKQSGAPEQESRQVVSSSEWLESLARRVERRAAHWKDSTYRNGDPWSSIAHLLEIAFNELAEDLRAESEKLSNDGSERQRGGNADA